MNVGQVEFAVLADGLEDVLARVTELENRLNNIDGRKVNIGKGVQAAAKQMGSAQHEMEHTLVNFGSRMQTLGRTLQNITAPFNNIMRGFTYGIGYRALNKVIDGFSRAFQRADILNTTEKVLKLQGFDLSKKFSVGTNKAATAMENLDSAVQGLPTSLDEIVASMKVYVGASEDVEKSTKMAIAANNAYIASGVDATRKRYSERQLQNLMSGAELTTQQWDSLRKNIPLAMNATAHELHMSMGDMISDLKNGRLETDKFIDAFIKVGTEGKIYKSAQKLKITWEALSENISIAFSRMGANILDTLNKTTKKLTGRTFLQQLLGVDKNGKDMGDGIKSIINDISDSAQEWIKANPDKILDFLDGLRNFDWKGMLGEIASFFMKMADVYGDFIHLIGGKNLARFMLWGNMVGKILTMVGGITRGLAGPLSKLFAGKAISKFFSLFTGAGMPALSWQDVASKGIGIAAIPAMAGSLVLVAKALQEFMKVDISWPALQTKLGQAMLAITEFGVMAGAIGALISSTGPAGWAGTVATGTGIAAITGISGAVILAAKALNDISTVEVPDAAKIAEVTDAIDQVSKAFEATNPFEAIGKMYDAWSKGVEVSVVSKMTKALEDIKKLSKIKISKDAMKTAKRNFRRIAKFISDLETLFSDEKAKEAAGTTNGALWRGNTNKFSTWQNDVAAFASIVENVTLAMDNMQALVTSAEKMQKLQEKLAPVQTAMKTLFGEDDPLGLVKKQPKGGNLDFTKVKSVMNQIADGMYGLIGGGENYQDSAIYKIKKVSDQMQGLKLDTVVSSLGNIPKIIEKMQAIAGINVGEINLDNLDGIADKIKTFMSTISSAFTGGSMGFGGGAQGFAMDVSSFYSAVNGIKKAIGELNSIPYAKDMSGVVKSVNKAINKLREIGTQIIDINITIQGTVTDLVGPKITAAAKAIADAWAKIQDEYSKSVKVKIKLGDHKNSVTPYINAAIRSINNAVNRIPSSVDKTVTVNIKPGAPNDPLGLLNPPHTGGSIVKNGPVYKALGGFAFKPRGTDTIPAMLTPGEYVMNRMAANAIGSDVLQRLNHLDISGAIRGLYMRTGMLGTVNNTKNANVTVNNYNAPDVGFAKASRWVQQL